MSNGSKSRNSLVSFVRNYREEARQESMKQRRKQAFQPMLDDKLEDRRLMTVTSSIVNIAPGINVLDITSTDVETISLFYNGVNMYVNSSQPSGLTGSAFNTIRINATVNPGQRIVNFTGDSTIDGQGSPISNITTTGNATYRVNQLTQQISFTSNPTVALSANPVSVSSAASVNQGVMLAGSGAQVIIQSGTYTETVVVNKNITLGVSGGTSSVVTLAAPANNPAIRIDSGSLTLSTPVDPGNTWATSLVFSGTGSNTSGIEVNGSGVSYTDSQTPNITFNPSLTQAYKVSTGNLTIDANRTNSGILVSGGSATINATRNLTGNVSVTGGTFTNNGTLTGTYTQSNGTGTNNGTITGAVGFSGGSLTLTPSSTQSGLVGVTGGALNVNVTLANMSVSGSGTVNILSSGNISNSLSGQGGSLTIATGGRVNGLVVNGTAASSCGTIVGPVTVSAGSLTLNNTSTQAGNFTVSGGALNVNSTVNNLTTTGGTTTILGSGVIATTTAVNNGTLNINAGGSVNALTENGSTAVIASCGTIVGNPTFTQGQATLNSPLNATVTVANATLNVNSNVTNVALTGSGTVNVLSLGCVTSTLSGQSGIITVDTGGLVSGLTVNGATATVCGTISSLTNLSNGTLTLLSNQTLNISALNNSTLNVGATVTGNVTSEDNSVVNINGVAGTATGLLTANGSGSRLNVLSGATVGNVIATAGTANLAAGTTANVVTLNGSGTIQASGTVTTLVGTTGPGVINLAGNVTGQTTISGTANLTNSGQLTGGLTANGSGVIRNQGIVSGNTAVSSGARFNGDSGSVANLVLTSNQPANINGGTVTRVDVQTGSTLLGNASASFGTLSVSNGTATLTGSSITNGVSVTGGSGVLSTSGSIAGGLAVATGSTASILVGGTADTVISNGTLTVNGTVSGATTVIGGTSTVQSNGVLAGPVNANGGTLNINNGGRVSALVVRTGSTVASCGTIIGNVTNIAGTLTLNNTSTQAGNFSVETGGVLNVNSSMPGTLNVTNGTATVQASGNVTGVTTNSNGSLTVNGQVATLNATGNTTSISGSGIVTGTATVSGTATLTSSGSLQSVVVQAGTANLTGGTATSLTQSNGTVISAANITGNVSLTGGNTTISGIVGGITTVNAGNLTSSGALNSLSLVTGTVNVTGGTVANLAQSGGELQSAGNITNASLTGGNTTISGRVLGNTTLAGGNLTASSGATLNNLTINSGTSNLTTSTITGLITVTTGNLTLAGTQSGSLTVNGATANVTLNTTVAGLTTATLGQLNINANTGDLAINGDLANVVISNATAISIGNVTYSANTNYSFLANATLGSYTQANTVASTTNVSIAGRVSGTTTVNGGNLTTSGNLSGAILANGSGALININGASTGVVTSTNGLVNVNANIGGLTVNGPSGTATFASTNVTVSGATSVTNGTLTVPANTTLAAGLTATNSTVTFNGAASSITNNGTITLNGRVSGNTTLNGGSANLTGGNYTGGIQLNAGILQLNSNGNFTGSINTVSGNPTTLYLPANGSVAQTGNLTLGANTTTQVSLFNSNGNPGGSAAIGRLVSTGNVVLAGNSAMAAFNLGNGLFPNATVNMPFIQAANLTGNFASSSLNYQGAITFTIAANSTQASLTNTTITGVFVSEQIQNTGNGSLTYFNVAGSNTTGVYGITAYRTLSEFSNTSYAGSRVSVTLGNGTTGDLLANGPNSDWSISLKAIGNGTVPVQNNAPISLTLGNVVLNSGDTLNISFFGQNTSISTDSLVVNGTTNITGSTLSLTNNGSLANTPAYTRLTIIDQLNSNVIGDFSGGIYNRSVNSTLFYGFTNYGTAGTSPRDVTFIQAQSQGNVTSVKVNDDWSNGTAYPNGTVISGNDIIGINAANNFSLGLSALASSSVAGNSSLILYNGNYAGDLNLSNYTGVNNLTVSVVSDSGTSGTYGTVSLTAGNITLASNVTLALDHGAASSNTDLIQANGSVTLGSSKLSYSGSAADYTIFQPVRTTNNTPISGAFVNGAFGGYASAPATGYFVSNVTTSQANATNLSTSVVSLIKVNNPNNVPNVYVSGAFSSLNGTAYSLPNSTTNTVVYGGINAFNTIDLGMANIADSVSSNLVVNNTISSCATVNVTKSFDILFMNANGGITTGALQIGSLDLNSNASPQLWDAGQVTANNIQLNRINGGTNLGSYNVLGLAATNTSANISFGVNANTATTFTTVAGSLIVSGRTSGTPLTILGNENVLKPTSGTGAMITFNDSANGTGSLAIRQLDLNAFGTANVTGINANVGSGANSLLTLDDITILNLAQKDPGNNYIPFAGNLSQGAGILRINMTGSIYNDNFSVLGVNPTELLTSGWLMYSGFSDSSEVGAGIQGGFSFNPSKVTELSLNGGANDDSFNFGSALGLYAPINLVVTNVNGGAGDDVLSLISTNQSPSKVTTFDGGADTNTLRIDTPQLYGDFQITGGNAGSLILSTDSAFTNDVGQTTTFSNTQNLVGSTNNATTYDRFVISQIQANVTDGSPQGYIGSIIGTTGATTTAPSNDQLILGANITAAGSTNANLSTWVQWNIETLDSGQGDANNVNKVGGNVQVFNNLTSGSVSAIAPVGSFLNLTRFVGGDQNDIYNISGTGKRGIKSIDGAGGTNSLDFGSWDNIANTTTGIRVDLRPGQAYATPVNNEQTSALSNINNVYGTNQNDTLYGNDLSNVLYGSSGNDSIFGYGGNDILIGDYGADSLVGGNGNDFLTGDHVDFYFNISGGDPAGVLPMEILLDVHQSGWKTATTNPTTFGSQATALSSNVSTSSSNYGTISVKGLTGVLTANVTADGSNANTTIFADYQLDSLTDTSGLNYLIYTAGVKNGQTGLLDPTANDYVPTSTIVTRRRYSRWNPWS